MRTLVPFVFAVVASPAFSQDFSGFYIGVDIAHFDTDFENLTVTADGEAYGGHAGYRYGFTESFFAEGEVFVSALDGSTDTGNTELESYYGITAGLGAYVTPQIAGTAFVGYANVESDNDTSGSESDDGVIYGLELSYDLLPSSSIAFRYSRLEVDGDFGDIDTDIFGVRFSFQF